MLFFLNGRIGKICLQQYLVKVQDMEKTAAIVTLLTILTLASLYLSSNQQPDQFELWKLKFGDQFDKSQQLYRRMIFEKNLRIIQTHNADPTQTYKMGINQFTVFSEQQFKGRFLTEIIVPQDENIINFINQQSDQPNADVDWSAQGKVSRVKNQGSCGACWAFAALATCESWGLINGKSLDLSQQQLVDCSGTYGNKGCDGGWPSWALKYVKDKGVASQIEYPYVARGQTCKKTGGSFKISNYGTVSNTCSALSAGLAKIPLAVAIDATNWSKYSSGIFSNCTTSLNHGVLLVGQLSGNWKIKNSWGPTWGQSGFMRLAGGNTCGICQTSASFPT